MLEKTTKVYQSINKISFKFLLFRTIVLDMLKEICLDAHKVQILETCRLTQKLSQTFPNNQNIFVYSNDILPEEIDKRIYAEQKRNLIRNQTKQPKSLCGLQMNVLNPFFIMGVEDIFKMFNDPRENGVSQFTSHLSKVDPASVGYIQAFYQISSRMPRNEQPEIGTELNLHLKYLLKIQDELSGGSKLQLPIILGMNHKSINFVRVLKYYINLIQFIYIELQHTQSRLDPSEMQVMLDMYILNQRWDDDEAQLQKKKTSNTQNRSGNLQEEDDMEIRESNKALMSYEEKVIDLKDDDLTRKKQKVIIHEAIDNIVQRVKNNIALQDTFHDFNHQLQRIYKHSVDNFVMLDELSRLFKNKASTAYKRLYVALNETLGQSFDRNPSTSMGQTFFQIHSGLYSRYHRNSLQVQHFDANFYNVGAQFFDSTSKHPLYRSGDIYRMHGQKARSNDPIKRIIRNSPFNLKRFIFTQDRKTYQIQAENMEDFSISQKSNQFTKLRLSRESDFPDRGYIINDNPYLISSIIVSQLNQFERRMMHSNIKQLQSDASSYAKMKLGKENINIFESKELEDAYLAQVMQLTMYRQALLLMQHKVDFPLYQFEYIRYLQDVKSQIQFNVQNLKALAQKPQEIVQIVLNKQTQKFLEMPTDNQTIISMQYGTKFMDGLVELLLEKDLCQKAFYLQLTKRGISAMSEDVEMLTTFRNLNDNLVERHKLYITKEKVTSRLAIGNNSMLPRVKNNPCFSSQLQREGKQDKMIPSQAKISFLQAFINRLRNKVSRVDLLSSGSGFVITINDLEDCVNYLHRSLYQFGEKELRARLETCQMLFDHQQSLIDSKNKEIAQLKLELSQLVQLIDKHTEGIIIQKGNQLLYDFDAVNRKLKDFSLYTSGLEDNLREQIRKEFLKENLQLSNEKDVLKQKLEDFKKELLVLCKTEIRTHRQDLVKFVKNRAMEILQQPLDEPFLKDKTKKVLEDLAQQFETKQAEIFPSFMHDKDQYKWKKCAPDEDVLFDPYVTTKLVNKIRAFHLIKLGTLKQRHSDEVRKYDNKIQSLQEVSQKVRDYQQREFILKKELVNLHETLNQQKKVNQTIISDLENVSFENKRLLKINEDLQQSLRNRQSSDRMSQHSKRRFMSLDTRTEISPALPKIQMKATEQQTPKKFKAQQLSMSDIK